MKIVRSLDIRAEPSKVFELIADPRRYPEFFQGVTRWKPLSDEVEVGARFRVLMQVGSIEAGGVVRVTEWIEPEVVAWEAEAGIRQRGRWWLEKSDRGTTLTLEVEYSLSGGPAGWLVERITSRIVGRHLWATLLATRRILERERS